MALAPRQHAGLFPQPRRAIDRLCPDGPCCRVPMQTDEPHLTVVRRDPIDHAIRQALANTNGVQVQAVEMTTSYMSYNGPAIVQTGDFSQTVKLPNGKVVTATGRFEATWIRSATGEWWIKRMVTRPNATKPS